ncbi:MAG: hypothetical protein AAFV95_19160 [Bacteroidota bacterium]
MENKNTISTMATRPSKALKSPDKNEMPTRTIDVNTIRETATKKMVKVMIIFFWMEKFNYHFQYDRPTAILSFLG